MTRHQTRREQTSRRDAAGARSGAARATRSMLAGATAVLRAVLAPTAVIAVIAVTVSVLAVPSASPATASAPRPGSSIPTRPTSSDPWLDTINWWRSFGGAADGSGAPFPTVSTVDGDSAGAQAQADYLASIWRLGSTYCGHGEDPRFPRGAGDYSHHVLFCGPSRLGDAIDGWMNTPYHAPPLLAPTVTRVGAGIATDGMRTVSTARTAATAPIDRVYTWPSNGGALPRTEMGVAETPDPTALCPSTGGDPGQPVFAWFPSPRTFVSVEVRDAAGTVPTCVLGDGSASRAVVTGDAMSSFTVFARRPYALGASVAITLVTADPATGAQQALDWGVTPLTTPDVVQATMGGQAGVATVDVAPAVGSQDGGAPILERQLLLHARSIGIVGDPVWRLPIPGTGVQRIPVPAGDYWACVSARNALGWSRCGSYSRLTVSEPPFTASPSTAGFVAVEPARLVDTRVPGSPVGRLRAGQVSVLDLRSQLPAGALAVALNVAAVNTNAAGWVRAYPCTAAMPATSSLNPEPRGVTTSAAIVKVGDGRICLQSLADTDLVIDLNGWLTTGSTAGLVTSTARRLLDTRLPGQVTRRLAAGAVVEVPVTAPGSTAVAVALNVTAVDPGTDGYVTAWPCGTARPFVANLTPAAGVTRPNLVNVRIGAGGSVCFYSTAPTDLVVDLLGEYRPGAAARFVAIDPVRLVDTRVAGVPVSSDGASIVPAADVVALQGTLTAAAAPAAGYLAAYACASQSWPGIANVNFRTGETSGNAVLMPAAGGVTCVRNLERVPFVVDVTGVWKTS